MTLPLPSQITALGPLSEALDAASFDQRLAWMRSLNEREMLRLYDLAEGNAVHVADLTGADGQVVIHDGKNGMPVFNRFQKRFARYQGEVVGFNWNEEIAGVLTPVVKRVVGKGHFTAYDSPEKPGEVWIDYRQVPKARHPDFPAIHTNDTGLPSVVFGNMVDIVRRVSKGVFIGNAFKDLPTDKKLSLGARIGKRLPTAPFCLVQEPHSPTSPS